MICVRIRNTRGGHTRRDTGDCHVNVEAEIGIMLPQIKKCLALPEARRHKDGFSHRAFIHLYISLFHINIFINYAYLSRHTHKLI